MTTTFKSHRQLLVNNNMFFSCAIGPLVFLKVLFSKFDVSCMLKIAWRNENDAKRPPFVKFQIFPKIEISLPCGALLRNRCPYSEHTWALFQTLALTKYVNYADGKLDLACPGF